MRWRSGDGSMLEYPGELVMEGSEEKWKFMRVVRGSIPSLSWVMDTNFFISPSLIIKHGSPAAAQYFWYYRKYSPQMRRKTRPTNNWADLRLNSKKNMTIRQKNQVHLVRLQPTDIRLGGYKSPYKLFRTGMTILANVFARKTFSPSYCIHNFVYLLIHWQERYIRYKSQTSQVARI